jgi:hypothetical protein
MASTRRQNGEHIGPKCAPLRLVAFANAFWFEMEAILPSLRDLIQKAHRDVGQA